MDRSEALFCLGPGLHRADALVDELARALFYMEAHFVFNFSALTGSEDPP